MTLELIVLGTASQAPTKHRNHNGYALRWDDQLIVFDPGEGFQRQCALAGLTISRATACCLTHFHGDHTLGLPGFLQRRALDGQRKSLPIWFPADGAAYLERLRTSTIWHDPAGIIPNPVESDGRHGSIGTLSVTTRFLDHRVTTVGYRLQQPDHFRLDAGLLHKAGIAGPRVGKLLRDGQLRSDNIAGSGQLARPHRLEDFGELVPGTSMAFIMDTRLCDAAFELADGADLLVCESTYLESEKDLALEYGHLTAAQAAKIAAESGVGKLVLTHFSERHPDSQSFVDEARQVHENSEAAEDLKRISVV